MNTAENFYDELSDQYHLISVGWEEAVRTQGKTLSKLIGSEATDVLDCSCGIGTQAIGLALEGHEVTASDVSSRAIAKAEAQAARLKAELQFYVSDFRDLEIKVPGTFNAVISCDNSVPHLITSIDMERAFRNMYSKLKAKGTLLISVRDYDLILKEKPSGMPPRKISDEKGTRIYMQTWDWHKAENIYEMELFLLKLSEGKWLTNSYKTFYRAWQREELASLLASVGFGNINWRFPEETGYFQPIITATRSN